MKKYSIFHALAICISSTALCACGGGGNDNQFPITTSLEISPVITSTWAGGPTITLQASANGGSPTSWSIDAGPGALSGSANQVRYEVNDGYSTSNDKATISVRAGMASASATVYVNFAPTSRFNFLHGGGIVEDYLGNIYVSDARNNVIRKITRDGNVSTFAGTGVAGLIDGPSGAAKFNQPGGLAIAGNGDIIVADVKNNAIRRIDGNGNVSTIAGNGLPGDMDGPVNIATFGEPNAVATDFSGNIYIADTDNHAIRKIDGSGIVSTFAGAAAPGYLDGDRTQSQFNGPRGIATDNLGNVYVADSGNNTIRKIRTDGTVITVAGGTAMATESTTPPFDFPTGIAVTAAGLAVADSGNAQIRLISLDGRSIINIGGQPKVVGDEDGYSIKSKYSFPTSISSSRLGSILVVDSLNNKIRAIENGTWVSRTIGGSSSESGFVNGTALPR
ncbi:hypothetical protein [Burkholderia territorii]|uniref:hypothetical protein n=1 Tax=Burkholderia territorii TaxID=1503055 RepID=UPI0009BF8DD4|nr:hypothetical protein [Burkholderia territorii]